MPYATWLNNWRHIQPWLAIIINIIITSCSLILPVLFMYFQMWQPWHQVLLHSLCFDSANVTDIKFFFFFNYTNVLKIMTLFWLCLDPYWGSLLTVCHQACEMHHSTLQTHRHADTHLQVKLNCSTNYIHFIHFCELQSWVMYIQISTHQFSLKKKKIYDEVLPDDKFNKRYSHT